MIRFIVAVILLCPSLAFAQSLNGNLLRLAPSTLPTLCRLGDLRVNTSNSLLEMCNGSNTWGAFSAGSTVSSVALADGSSSPIYSVSGSPITTSGTLTFSLTTESAAKVFAGPTSGADAVPTFRSLVSGDIPTSLPSLVGIGTVTSGSWNAAAVPSQYGGTGQNLSASTGILHVLSGAVTAASVSMTADVTSTLPATNGGTGNAAYTVGDILISSVTNQLARLSAGSNTFCLISNGAGVAPSWQACPGATGNNSADALTNVAITSSVVSNSTTISLKQADGSTDPASSTGAVTIGVRNPTATNGGYNQRAITSSTSVNISQYSNINTSSAAATPVFVYAVDSDSAGTMKLAVSTGRLDDRVIQNVWNESMSVTATSASPAVFTAAGHNLANSQAVRIAGTAPTGFTAQTVTYYLVNKTSSTFQLAAMPGGTAINSSTTGSGLSIHMADSSLVSNASYASVAVRLIGKSIFNESTPGTWATAASTNSGGMQAAPSYSWEGYFDNNCNWGLTSATITDFAVDTSCTFAQLFNTNMGQVVAYTNGTAGSFFPGIVFSPPVPGSYHICALAILSNTVAEAQSLGMYDGSNNEISLSAQVEGLAAGGAREAQPICADYVVPNWPASVVIKLRGAAPTGTLSLAASGNIGRSLPWSIHWNGY